MGKVYGYLRQSPKVQLENTQLNQLLEAGVEENLIFTDKASNTASDCAAFRHLLRKLNPGDLLFVVTLDHLGKTCDEVKDHWRIITIERGCDLAVLDTPLLDTRQGETVKDLVLEVLIFSSRIRRNYARQRQAEGIALAKANDIFLGRPAKPIPDNFSVVADMYSKKLLSARVAAERLNVDRKTFLKWYLAAADYYREHGHLIVPKSYISPDGIKLGYWIAHLRVNRSGKGRGKLTDEQIARLDRIGMAWDADEGRWQIGYAGALQYSREHGNLNVPISYKTKDGYRLGLWISLKRRQYKKGTLTAQQIADLERIGMRWEVFAEHWQEMYDEAKAYSETNGNLKVPRSYLTSNGYNLNLWLSKMKREQDRLSDGQITALTAIGMRWPAAARQEAVR